MKKLYFFGFSLVLGSILINCTSAFAASSRADQFSKGRNILYFNPEIYPDIAEIREPTYAAFYAAVSEKKNDIRDLKMLRVDSALPFDSADSSVIREFCANNDAALAVIPKVKYFKVGFGKYIFSNQVVISMKMYDAAGNFLTETSYDTYRKNARLLGSAENSIRIGTVGAIQSMSKNLSRLRREGATTNAKAQLF